MARNVTSAGMEEDAAKAVDLLNKRMLKIAEVAGSMDWGAKNVDKLKKRLSDIRSKIQEANLKGDKDRADILQKRLDKMSIEIANPRDLKRLSKGAADAAQTFGEGLHGAFQTFKSKDLGSMAGAFKKMAQSATTVGTKMEANASKGMGGDAIAGLGKAMSTLGPAIAAIAGAAVGIAALVKIVFDADSRIKDLNKSMIAAGVSGQEFGDDVGEGMSQVRKAFTGTGSTKWLNDLGTTSKETIDALGGFQKAGTTFEEIRGKVKDDTEAVDKLREAVKGAVVYSKLLGESADKVAGDMAKMAEETSSTLEGVRDKFGEIAAAAKQSGFDTKRFYGMVLEVTTGMSMYNVRLQDTIGLLTQAGKVLGPDAGKAWAQSLTGGMKEVSTRDMTVNAMKMGKGNVQGAAKLDATNQASALKDSFMSIQKAQGKPAEQMAAAFKLAGVGNLAEMKPDDMEKTLGNMSKENALILRSELNKVEGVSGLGTKTAHAQKVARTGEGLGGLGGQVEGMKNFGAIGTLLAKIGGSNAVDKGLDTKELDPENLVKNMAKESLQSGAGALTSQDKDMIWNAMGSLKAKQKTEGKNAGNTITNENVAKELGLMQKAADEEAKKAETDTSTKENAWKRDQELASKIVENTQSFADVLENKIEQLLTTISEGISSLVNWFLGGQGAEDKKAKSDALDEGAQKLEDLTEELGNVKGKGPEQDEQRKLIREQIAEQRELNKTMSRDTKTTGNGGNFERSAKLAGLTDDQKKEMAEEVAKARTEAWVKNKDQFGGYVGVGQETSGIKIQDKAVEDKYMARKGLGTEHKKFQLHKEATLKGMSSEDTKAMSEEIASATEGQTAEEAKKTTEGITKKYYEKQKKIDDDRVQKQTDDLIKADDKRAQEAEINKITAGLDPTGANKDAAAAAARAIVEGTTSTFTGDKSLLEKGNKIRSGEVRMNDGELTYSENGEPREFAAIAADDVVDVHHKGRHRRGGGDGGGNITIQVNQWGDVPGAILKAMETMRVRT